MKNEFPKKVGFERIRNAAILYNGRVFEGTTHGHAMGQLLSFLKDNEPALYSQVHGHGPEMEDVLYRLHGSIDFEGYVTAQGRFVTRVEATDIARSAKQLRRHKDIGSPLYSEEFI